MSRRPPTPAEVAAAIVFHDRYVAHRNGAIEFWRTLTAAEQDWIDHLIRAVADAATAPDPTWPQCPKRCDVATRPEYAGPGRWVCEACGMEFDWPVAALDTDGGPPTPEPERPPNVLPFPA